MTFKKTITLDIPVEWIEKFEELGKEVFEKFILQRLKHAMKIEELEDLDFEQRRLFYLINREKNKTQRKRMIEELIPIEEKLVENKIIPERIKYLYNKKKNRPIKSRDISKLFEDFNYESEKKNV